MNRFLKKSLAIAILFFCSLFSSVAQENFTLYVDPTIGNVAQFLVPTYPTIHLPNQMVRMFPVKQDYISDQVDAFPLQVVSHRDAGILQLRVNRFGDMFFLPISKHFPVKLHESLLNAETMKPALSRQ